MSISLLIVLFSLSHFPDEINEVLSIVFVQHEMSRVWDIWTSSVFLVDAPYVDVNVTSRALTVWQTFSGLRFD